MTAPRPMPASWRVAAAFVAGAFIGALSAVEVVPNFTASPEGQGVVSGSGDGGLITLPEGNEGSPLGKGKGGKAASAAGPMAGGPTSLVPSKPGLECAPGKNGGATDRGVTGSEIKMATTVAESGIAAAFLGEMRYAMEAVRNEVNRAGGICGRTLSIEYRDDGWSAQTGAQYLRNFIQEGIFAIPVCPSSEGCRVIIDSGDLDRTQTPLVGSDGLLRSQYTRGDGTPQPWVWPVATATISSARIMCEEAYKRGARGYSIVFDRNYRFGVEAAEAFNACVRSKTGNDIPGYNRQYTCQQSFCGINAGKSSYSTEVGTFTEGDFVALFLEPQTALTWMSDPNTPAPASVKHGYGAAQPLFTREFAVNCQDKCDRMQVWTGFKPPIESYKNDGAVRRYIDDLKREQPSADEFNAFTEGAYVGMLLLVDALEKIGPEVTRARLQAALNQTSLASGLTLQRRISFAVNLRFANVTMQGFVIQHRGNFAGWREGPIVRDSRA